MLTQRIAALATALLVQVSIVLSGDVVGYGVVQNGIRVLNQEVGQRTGGQNTQGQAQETGSRGGQSEWAGDQGRQSRTQPYQGQSTERQAQSSGTQSSRFQPTRQQGQQSQNGQQAQNGPNWQIGQRNSSQTTPTGRQGQKGQQLQAQQSQSSRSQVQKGQQPQALQGQSSQNQESQPRPNAGASGQCFLSNGSPDPMGIACVSNNDKSRCCGPNEFCSTNKLCVSKNDPNKYARSSCLDATFQSGSCLNVCLACEYHGPWLYLMRLHHSLIHNLANNTGTVLPCGDPSQGRFCCDEGQGFACCSSPNKILEIGRGKTFAAAGSLFNSKPNPQPQLTSQAETTPIETATQTVISTSVSISIQSVTATSTFSPTVAATASTSIILTTSQNQPTFSIQATRSESVLQNQNSQVFPKFSIFNPNSKTQPSSISSNSNGNQNQNQNQGQNQNGQSTTSSANPQSQSQAGGQNGQHSSTSVSRNAHTTIIVVGVVIVIIILSAGIGLFCYIKRRQRTECHNPTWDEKPKGRVQGFESEEGSRASERSVKLNGAGKDPESMGLFVTVSEKFKGLKEKAQAARLNESDRLSREFDGALGGGMYLEGGTLGRGRRPGNVGGGKAIDLVRKDTSLAVPAAPSISTFDHPRTPPQPPPPPSSQPSRSRESGNSQRSGTSGASGSQYSRLTAENSTQIPSASDLQAAYYSRSGGDGRAYGMVSREGGQGLGTDVNGKRQTEPRGFF